MQKIKKRSDFFDSPEAIDIKQRLEDMALSDLYNTASSFTTDKDKYPDNLQSFADKHMNYLNSHPKLDADMYLANLRLMTRVR